MITLGGVLAALVLPASAFAVTGWTARDTEDALMEYGLDWSTGHAAVYLAICKGFGMPLTTLVHPLHFHTLNCWVLTNENPHEYKIRVTIKPNGYQARFLRYTPGYFN